MTQSEVLYATFDVLPGKRDKVVRLISELAEEVRTQEEGNLKFKVFHDKNDPNHFHIEQEYASKNALDLHFAAAHREKFNREVAPYIVNGQSAVVYLDRVV